MIWKKKNPMNQKIKNNKYFKFNQNWNFKNRQLTNIRDFIKIH